MPTAFSRFKYGLAHGNDLLNLSFSAENNGREFLLVIKYNLKKRISTSFERRKKNGGFYDKRLALTLF